MVMSSALALCRSFVLSSAGSFAAGLWSAGLLLALSTTDVAAQVPYKVVSPDGKVTYTDRPVVAQPGTQMQALKRDAISGSAAAGPPLPANLRAVQVRFPVTVYTTGECASCDSGRRLLQGRGVPYVERLVASEDDVDALQRLSGGRSLPVLTVGGQTLRGFSESDWLATLDLAGYPKESRLPRGWQAPAPEPLVARVPAVAPRAPDEARGTGEPAFPQAASDPSGIRF